MRNYLSFLVVLFIITSSCKAQVEVNTFAESITSENLKNLLYTYSSDAFEGRETGQAGQKKAVEFIKEFYVENDIPSALESNYFQEVPLQIVKTPEVNFTVNNTTYTYFDDYISYSSAPTVSLNESELIFVGYGIDDNKYNDYQSVDVKDKIVLIKGGEPKDNTGKYIISGTKEISKWSNGRQAISSKKEAALTNGAKAVLFIDQELFNRYSPYYKRQYRKGDSNRLSLLNLDKEIHFFLLSKKMGEAILPKSDIDNPYSTIAAQIHIDYKSITVPMSSENVVAYIEGSEKPNEFLIVSAHLDHIGISSEGEVYNGADDNGSGSVAVLEIAKAFKKASDIGYKPKRSIVFLHVTGEEKGMLGSNYYTDQNPVFPLNQTIANLNIDMIGRIDPKRKSTNRNYIYLIGSDKLSTDLHNLSEDVNKKYMNIELDYKYNNENDPNRYYYRSDHYNFAKNNIPVIFYFNGTHDDYHAFSDTPDKIEYDLLENRTRLVFLTAWEIANREKTITVDKDQ
jgi:hypothetical protein